MLKNRKNLVNVELPRGQADYLKRIYGAKSHSSAIKQGVERLCQLDPEMVAAIKFDHDSCLAVSEETKVRLMHSTGYPDWRFAALHILSDYLRNYYVSLESDKVTSEKQEKETQEENNV
jgi:hypothetical protein